MTNYFEFYGLPVKLMLNQDELKKLYIAKSREFHPDFLMNAGEEEKSRALEQSTVNNKAFATLKDATARLMHVLELNQVLKSNEQPQLPSSFLMEMMDLNEAVEMANTPEKQTKVMGEIQAYIDASAEKMQTLFEVYDKADQAVALATLQQLAELYMKNKYFLRLKQSVSTFAV